MILKFFDHINYLFGFRDAHEIFLTLAGSEELIEVLMVKDIPPEVIFELYKGPLVLPRGDVQRSRELLYGDLFLEILTFFKSVHLGFWVELVEHLFVGYDVCEILGHEFVF